MHRTLVLALVILAPCILFGCGGSGGDTMESLSEETVDLMGEFADILEGVTDKETAEAAKPKLMELGEKMQELQRRIEAIRVPTEEDTAAMMALPGAMEARSRITQQAFRIGANPELQGILEEALNSMAPAN